MINKSMKSKVISEFECDVIQWDVVNWKKCLDLWSRHVSSDGAG